jgi:amino acid transporter
MLAITAVLGIIAVLGVTVVLDITAVLGITALLLCWALLLLSAVVNDVASLMMRKRAENFWGRSLHPSKMGRRSSVRNPRPLEEGYV